MPKTDNPKAATKHLAARVLVDTAEGIEAIARRDGASTTSIIQRALNQYVERDRAYREAHAAFIVDLSRDAALQTLYKSAIPAQAASSAHATAEKANPPAVQPPNAPGVAGAVSAPPVAEVPPSGDLPEDYEPKFTGKNPPKPAGDQS